MTKVLIIIHHFLKRLAIAGILPLIFVSCEKVIEVDLHEEDPRLVVEGNITNEPGPHIFMLSQTASYFESYEYIAAEDAQIFLSDSHGNRDTLDEIEPGIYLTSLPGVPDRTYYLNIFWKGETFTAESYMPEPVKTDSVTYEYVTGELFQEDGYYATAWFTDPGGVDNYYQQRLYRNGDLYDPYAIHFTFSDDIFEGNVYNRPFFEYPLNPGDTVAAELYHFDKEAYKFFSTLYLVAEGGGGGGPFAGTPQNPVSNISNDAMGFFGAFSISRGVVIVEE